MVPSFRLPSSEGESMSNGASNEHKVNGVNSGSRIEDKSMPIAVVGMGCRFPGDATNPENLWKMVAEAREAWSPFPDSKFNGDAFYHPDPARNGTSNVRGGHFLKQDLALFDAPFFNMTSAEVGALDPQQRLLLETCYEALENAGIPIEKAVGSNTSVFVGSFCRDFPDMLGRDYETLPIYQATGSGPSLAFLSNRLSYFFDFKGPSVTVDTACSASLVALHLACQTLRTGESRQAIVGGSNVILNHEMMISMSMMRFLSPEGRCYSFDHRANGYARGEGAACIVLKPLEEALKDGDTIRAVIRNTGINQDGKTAGITLPSGEAQEALIASVYGGAGLDPIDTTYVECHGTGTPAGDPLETAALSRVLSLGRSFDEPLAIGSIKTNMGHLEGASGLAGLIKTVLMLENKLILPNRNFEKANPRIPLYDWKLKVPVSLKNWNSTERETRRASINSFGYGGTNAHVILDDAQGYLSSRCLQKLYRTTPSLLPKSLQQNGSDLTPIVNGNGTVHDELSSRTRIFVLTAFDETSGKRRAKDLAAYLRERSEFDSDTFLDNLAVTLNERRSNFQWKLAICADSIDKLIGALDQDDLKFSKAARVPTLGFVFTGQGAQWHAMGRELIKIYPVFRQSIHRAENHLGSLGSPWSLSYELSKDAEASRVGEASFSQPLCTAIQIALVDLLAAWDIKPAAVTGHSSGEIAAAYAAGMLTLEDAIAAAYHRGVAASRVKSKSPVLGSMMAIRMSKQDAEPIVASLTLGKVVVACENSPSSITISGDSEAISELQGILDEKKIFARKLTVEVAYHSHHMNLVAEEYLASLEGLCTLECGDVEFYSSVTGRRAGSHELTASYWVSNMVSEVRFMESLNALCLRSGSTKKRRQASSNAAIDVLIEIGPHSALAGPIKQILQADGKLKNPSISYMSVLTRNTSAARTAIDLTCQLFQNGYPLRFAAINRPIGHESKRVLVDLPPYAWNHSTAFWLEPRISKAYRARPHPRTDLLGVAVHNSNPLEPQWRNPIRSGEIPWVRDHKVQSNIVYPAAGFVVMAIEAAHQRASGRGIKISGYKLREISIGQALIVPEYSGEVETMISLRPYNESVRATSGIWDEFCIFSTNENNSWTEHCRGLISTQKPSNPSEVDGARHIQEEIKAYTQDITKAEAQCTTKVNVKDLYEKLQGIGLEYGPTFANLRSARAGPGRCIGTISIPDTAAVMPSNYEFPFVLHPATLDSCLHPLFAAIAAEQGFIKDPIVPTFIGELFVSTSISAKPGHGLVVYADSNLDSKRIVTSLLVVDEGHTTPLITIKELAWTSLGRDSMKKATGQAKRLCFEMLWKPDADFLTSEQMNALCGTACLSLAEKEQILEQEQAGFYCMEHALQLVPIDEVSTMHAHHKKFYACMQYFCEAVRGNGLDFDTGSWVSWSDEERARLIARVGASGEEGDILCHVGKNLPAILRKEVESLSLMMEKERLDKYYVSNPRFARTYQHAATYIDLLSHKNPHLHILEIGAGTAGATIPILQALGGSDGTMARFSNYDFTDISTGFFEKSREKTMAWGTLINFRKLDIESDPLQQGYQPHAYDVVIAANVLHATRQMEKTIRNVRKLLKPGGKLVLVELTHERMTTSTIFGTLPGWWAGEEGSRQLGPTMTEVTWDELLWQTGFSGLQAAIRDSPADAIYQGSMMVSVASSKSSAQYPEVTIISNDRTRSLSLCLVQILNDLGVISSVATLTNADPSGKVCIVLCELAQSILKDPSTGQLDLVREILTGSAGVLWVVRGSTTSNPESNMIAGLARTVRSENGNTNIFTLDLDGRSSLSEEAAVNAIVKVFEANFNTEHSGDLLDVEFAEKDGYIMIPRLVEDKKLNNFIDYTNEPPIPEDQPFHQPGRPLSLEIGIPGLLDTLHFTDDVRLSGDLPDDHVCIEVKASGINFRDVMMAMGQIKVEPLGGECSGVVSAVGKSAEGLRVGDRVVTYAMGTFTNFIRQKARAVQKLPDGMPFEVGATLPIIYCTAYHSLFNVAHMVKGETILIHAASGGLGQATIMLSQLLQAEIFATVGTSEKKNLLMDSYGIPDDHIFSSRDNNFEKGIMRLTQGKGVDVIMNSLAGDALRVTWNCIAPFGRFIELGKRDFFNNTRLEMAQFASNVTFAAVDFISLMKDRFEETSKMWSDIMSLVREGAIKPPQPITAYSMSDVEKALRTMQSGKHVGKLVAMARPNEIVRAIPRDRSSTLLGPDVSYLLVGGLGGLGRAMALWMMQHGARNLIFASRSGLAMQSAREVVSQLRAQGANVAIFNCDIGDSEQVAHMIAESEKTMPPIRGVIQGAMILRDVLFQNLTLSDYLTTIRPKVHGTLNLHNLLSHQPLDFFILLSSTSGILGNPSQAAYAAASTYLDAFAAYRNSLNLPAVSFDLGVIDSVGYVAENEDLKKALEKQGFIPIRENELMAMLKSAILNPSRTAGSAQTITGLGIWKEEGARPAFAYPLFSHFRRIATQTASTTVGDFTVSSTAGAARAILRTATSVDRTAAQIADIIIAKIAALLMIPAEEISPMKSITDYGIDSLMAVEMRNWIFREMDTAVPILKLLGSETILRLARMIMRTSRLINENILKEKLILS